MSAIAGLLQFDAQEGAAERLRPVADAIIDPMSTTDRPSAKRRRRLLRWGRTGGPVAAGRTRSRRFAACRSLRSLDGLGRLFAAVEWPPKGGSSR